MVLRLRHEKTEQKVIRKSTETQNADQATGEAGEAQRGMETEASETTGTQSEAGNEIIARLARRGVSYADCEKWNVNRRPDVYGTVHLATG